MPMRTKCYTSKPISQVETSGSLVPPGVSQDVLAKHLGAHELRINRSQYGREERTEGQIRMIKEFSELKNSIIFSKPMPPSAIVPPGFHSFSPVRWSQIETKNAVARGEALTQDQTPQHQVPAIVKGAKRPSTARPPKGKYATIYPPPKAILRPQSAGRAMKDKISPAVTGSLVCARLPPATVEGIKTSILRIASAEEEHFEDGLGAFLTQARSINTARPCTGGYATYIDPIKPKWEHLEPWSINSVVSSMPLACQGRLVVSTDVVHILDKRQAGLKSRVMYHARIDKALVQDDVVQRNKLEVLTSDSKRQALNERAQLMQARQQDNAQRREDLVQASDEKTTARIQRHELSLQRKRALEAHLDRQDRQRHMLALMAFAFKTSRLFDKMRRWQKHYPKMKRQRWAVLVIEKHYQHHRSQQFSKKRSEALFLLAVVFAKAIRNWRERFKHKKAMIIVTYLREVGNFAKIQVAVKRFRSKIVRAQTYVRKSLAANHARYELLEMQWNKVDGERKAQFDQRRDDMLTAIQEKVDPKLKPKGSAQSSMEAKFRLIESYSGLKKLNECKDALAQKRRQYCEYFLPADMQSLQDISVVVKRRMLEMYVKKSRLRYNHEWEEYKDKIEVWKDMLSSQQSIKAGSLDLINSLGGGRGSQYLAKALDKFSLKLEKPKMPPPNLILPPQVMRQMIQKAVDHSHRITLGKSPRAVTIHNPAAKNKA